MARPGPWHPFFTCTAHAGSHSLYTIPNIPRPSDLQPPEPTAHSALESLDAHLALTTRLPAPEAWDCLLLILVWQEEKSRAQRNTGILAKEKLEKGWLGKRHTAGDRESWTPGAHRCFRSSPQPVGSDLHPPFPDHTAHGNGPHLDGTDPKAQLLLCPCISLLTVPCDALKGLEKGNRLGEEGRCGGAALG